ncbi:MAG: rod shape-determining protein RodA [Clostridiales bacterium]|nr:rod shape-determining protein RodA [Clostridiales bacterium]MDO4350262.1 FtsW/RodA/SpoVE family cell cycle protein [Eubacteriales bacterium]MDY4009110.1 FtsW/RodA/SpoVE family cell cycle protein [Candidatus Limiplasma sp.]
MMLNESRRSRAHFDLPLALMVFGLAAFGVLSVSVATFNTSSQAEDTILNYIVASYYGMRQAIFFLIAPVIVGVITYFPYEFIRRRSTLFYYVACGLLLVALGGQAAGVKAWIDIIWGYTIQPSEFVKLACIIVTAKYLEGEMDPMSNMRSVLRLGVLMGIPWVLTLAQGEMGSVLVMIFVFGVMMYFGGMRLRIMGGIVAVGVIGLALLYGYMMATGSENYRLVRILSFVNPELVDENAVYQVSNSKIAIGSGGLHGRGIFVQGSFSQLDYVPEDWTDFIFSTIGEAFGFVGCALVILTYLLIIVRMLYLARYTLDRFGQMIIIGVMAMLLFHVFENVGMTTGLMPVTGIPLPFLSYGGSNLVTNMAGIGLVLNVIKNRSVTMMPGIAPQTLNMRKWAQ